MEAAQSPAGGPRRRGIFYGWWLLGVGVFALAVVIGPYFHGLGAFFVALEASSNGAGPSSRVLSLSPG